MKPGETVRVELGDTRYWQRNIPCQDACPVHTDARGYVRAIAAGEFERAYLIARSPNPLASTCGRVCGAPCERRCRRGSIDRPISIRALKRFVCDRFGPEARGPGGPTDPGGYLRPLTARGACDGIEAVRHLVERFKALPYARPTGPRVGIIGSGPAGLAAAHDLCLMGFRPVVFEMEPVPAGMLYVGVPEYRLPRDVILSEVAVIEALGAEIRCGVEVGRDIGFDEVVSEHAATIVAVGGKRSRRLGVPGADGPGVLGGVEFLRDVALGRPVDIGRRVVVIGGGSVAYDAARTTLRQSYVDISRTVARQQRVEKVYLVCLESPAEMPADEREILEGDEEGVDRRNGWGPVAIHRDGQGRVTGVEFQRCLRAFDEEGRFAPAFDPGERMTIPCDTVAITIGQAADLSFIDPERDGVRLTGRGLMAIDPETLMSTSRPGVFAAGDVSTGMRLMIDAVASGKRAARSVWRYLTGDAPSEELTDFHRVLRGFQREKGFEGIPRVEVPLRPVAERLEGGTSTPVELGYSEQQAVREAGRCLDCGVNTIFDGSRCILCGGCVDVCPMLCLKIVRAERLGLPDGAPEPPAGGSAIVKDERRCIRCANCADRCPTGAITMERFCFEERIT